MTDTGITASRQGTSATHSDDRDWPGDEATVSRLLKMNGHLVSAVDAHGRTALLLACVGLHLELAKTLVEAGADVSSGHRSLVSDTHMVDRSVVFPHHGS